MTVGSYPEKTDTLLRGRSPGVLSPFLVSMKRGVAQGDPFMTPLFCAVMAIAQLNAIISILIPLFLASPATLNPYLGPLVPNS